jgi:hypothetical protein
LIVVIVSQELNPTADEVVLKLGERGVPVFRIDRAWFPQRLTLEAELRNDRWAASRGPARAGCLASAAARPGGRRVKRVFDDPASRSRDAGQAAFTLVIRCALP